MSDSKKYPPTKAPKKGTPAKKTAGRSREIAPDQRKITKTQAGRLAALTSLKVDQIAGRTTIELGEEFEWQIDPLYFTHRRVCGRVVQEDPATGELWGVPNATVEVEDTDCSYLTYFPIGYLYGWFFPYNCHREVVATTTTDECGNFCVWIPRWDIDWILKWRKERLCFPELVPPRVCDLLKIDPGIFDEPILRNPIPLPDPGPRRVDFNLDIERIRRIAGDRVADQAQDGLAARAFGAHSADLAGALLSPTLPLPPPKLPLDRMDLEPKLLNEIDPGRWTGPFLRCHDVYYPEWSFVFDAPDITFRVTQDVGGTETEVYSEGYFQVRWDDSSYDIELRANGSALATPICDGPDIDPGSCSKPTIVTAGLMPLGTDTATGYHDHATGYALRPNKPRNAAGTPIPPANAPYWSTVQLHGCHRFDDASFYRVLHSYEGGPELPFYGVNWYTPKSDGTGNHHVVPDADGWYPVLDEDDFQFPHWLFNWETQRGQNGRHDVRIEIADGAKNSLDHSAVIPFEVDNTRPTIDVWSLRWRTAGGSWQTLDVSCPVIRRPATTAIEIEAKYRVSAEHFRNLAVSASDCDGNSLGLLSAPSTVEHWHLDASDNLYESTALYSVPAGSVEGPYSVHLAAHGRAFNPAGGDEGPGVDWDYDRAYANRYATSSICIINT